MSDTTLVAKAFSDSSRVRAYVALQTVGDLCVCQITELLGLATATVSRHMSVLRSAGLVESYKKGRWVHYTSIEDEKKIPGCIKNWICEQCAEDPVILGDVNRLPTLSRCN